MERVLFPLLVALGLAGIGAMVVHEHRAPDRLRARAAAAGLDSADLSIREMG
jgi:hypothetical protein